MRERMRAAAIAMLVVLVGGLIVLGLFVIMGALVRWGAVPQR